MAWHTCTRDGINENRHRQITKRTVVATWTREYRGVFDKDCCCDEAGFFNVVAIDFVYCVRFFLVLCSSGCINVSLCFSKDR